jgi:hypothetical protein
MVDVVADRHAVERAPQSARSGAVPRRVLRRGGPRGDDVAHPGRVAVREGAVVGAQRADRSAEIAAEPDPADRGGDRPVGGGRCRSGPTRSTVGVRNARSGASTRCPSSSDPDQATLTMTAGWPCISGGTNGAGGAVASMTITDSSSGTCGIQSRTNRSRAPARSPGWSIRRRCGLAAEVPAQSIDVHRWHPPSTPPRSVGRIKDLPNPSGIWVGSGTSCRAVLFTTEAPRAGTGYRDVRPTIAGPYQ